MRLGAAAEQALRTREWRGNVRELRNAIERAVLLATDPVLGPADFESLVAPRATPTGEPTLPFPAPLQAIVVAAAQRMLELCGGNKSEAARRLGISRPRLARLLDPQGVDAADDELAIALNDSPEAHHA